MKKILALLLGMVLTVSVYGQSMKGEWNFQIPDAPYGYQSGSVLLKEQGKQLQAQVEIGYNTFIVKLQKIKNKYNGSFTIDGSSVEVVFESQNNKQMKATAVVDGQSLDVKLIQKKKK